MIEEVLHKHKILCWVGTFMFVSNDRFLYLCFCPVLISPVWGEQRSVWIRRYHYQPQQHRLVMISPCESVFVCVSPRQHVVLETPVVWGQRSSVLLTLPGVSMALFGLPAQLACPDCIQIDFRKSGPLKQPQEILLHLKVLQNVSNFSRCVSFCTISVLVSDFKAQ